MNSRIAVIGLGGFGLSIVRELSKQKFNILAIDVSKEAIDQVQKLVTRAVVMDTTNEDTMKEIQWDEIDVAVIAIGPERIDDSIMTIALLKEFGVPQIIARAGTSLHEKILRKIGADKVVNPENDMGKLLAQKIANPNLIDIRYFDEFTVMSEMTPPTGFVGKSIVQLDLRKKHRVSIIALRRNRGEGARIIREEVMANPSPDEVIQEEDILVVIGRKIDVEMLGKL
jgi:trk system potassium uptake protein TrkA